MVLVVSKASLKCSKPASGVVAEREWGCVSRWGMGICYQSEVELSDL